MASNRAMMTTLALGAAYLLRNEKSRNKIMGQMKALGGGSKGESQSQQEREQQKSLPLG